MVLRPGGTDESSPAIYRRVRDHMGPRPGGTPEYRRAINSKDIVLQSRYRVSLEKLTLCASGHRSLNLLAQFGHSNQVRRDALPTDRVGSRRLRALTLHTTGHAVFRIRRLNPAVGVNPLRPARVKPLALLPWSLHSAPLHCTSPGATCSHRSVPSSRSTALLSPC